MSFLQCLRLLFVIMLPALDLHLTFFGFRFFSWSLVGACIAQLSYAIVECLGYLFCLLDAFPFQFTITMGSMKARQKPRWLIIVAINAQSHSVDAPSPLVWRWRWLVSIWEKAGRLPRPSSPDHRWSPPNQGGDGASTERLWAFIAVINTFRSL